MSNEVSQFLEQVERLRGQQIEEDEVRARELEEYLAAKRERQARRQERARSISPQKSSPANTPSPRSNRRSVLLSDALKLESPGLSKEPTPEPTRDLSPAKAAADEHGSDAFLDSASSNKENDVGRDPDAKPAITAATTTRGSPLSWQRRPGSRGTGSRPLSMVAAQNATQRSLAGTQEPASATETAFSKDQIAQALGSKDPAWFRQTADRGASSAAYRKNQVEDEDRLDMASIKAQLPGMTPDPDPDPAKQPSPSPVEPAVSTPSRGSLASPPTLNPPKFETPIEDKPAERSLPRSPSGRTSPFRSTSPTKGVGGFVQSAMMKRSDSVKRWSVTSPPGLARADSIASSRSGTFSRPQSMYRPKTPTSSRPTSRHGEDEDEESTPKAPALDTSVDRSEGHIPTSPSKTMDPRRWSPTKSSWLESALNKPESPKIPQHKPNSSQPAWMAELNKNKAEKSSTPGTESGRPRPGSISHKHQVSIGGLMRSTPMGSASKTNTPGLGGIYSPPPGGNRPISQISNISMSKSTPRLGASEFKEKPTSPISRIEPETPSETQSEAESEEPSQQPDVQKPEKPEPVASPKVTSPPVLKPKPESVTSPKITSPPLTKPKPETPPKKDFRSSLKHRPTDAGGSKTEEPEFKNVFGNLRRTKTQNYVAPDELKDNILRGKAALNLTGGPKKTERVDEFKEALLKKKDDFKKAQAEGRGISRTNTLPAEKPVPEGLARRAELGKSLSSKTESASESASAKKAESPKPTPGPKRVSSGTTSSPKVSTPTTLTKAVSAPEKLVEPVEPAEEPKELARKPMDEPRPLSGVNAAFKTKGRVGGRLADRFNPALAGMLARGPPPMAANGGQDSGEQESKPSGGSSEPVTEPTGTGPQLTHMTKGRARGPRRKAPTKAAAAASPTKTEAPVKPTPEARPLPEEPAKPIVTKPVLAPKPSEEEKPAPVEKAEETKPAPLSIQQQVAAKASIRSKPTPTKPLEKAPEVFKSPEPFKPSLLRKKSASPVKETPDTPSPLKPQKTGGDGGDGATSPKKLDMKRMSRFMDEASSDNQKSEPIREPVKLTHQRTGSRSPVKMTPRPLPEPEPSSPTKVDSDPVVSVKNGASMFGGAAYRSPPPASKPTQKSTSEVETPKPQRMSARPSPAAKSSSFERQTPETPKSIKSPPSAKPSPVPGRKPTFDGPAPEVETPKPSRTSTRPLPAPPTQDVKSPPSNVTSPNSRPSNDVAGLLHDFFGADRTSGQFRVDTAELLMNRPKISGKIQTTSFQMFQISGDGKKVPVAPHFERVLFEREMYMCPHSFVNEAGWKRSEIYFWIGDEVPEPTVEDAHVFIQREVKSIGGTMIKMRQGRETSEFLQALGGVGIIRRGSNTKYDSLAPNMLCGRRWLGQVVFDEVDFSAASLCAGFPYLITNGGKCFLWKGKGSDVEELACARLIGMDLTLTGELLEQDEGSETAAFWDLFEDRAKALPSADHWRLKPSYPLYSARLFSASSSPSSSSPADPSRRQVSLTLNLSSIAGYLTNSPPPAAPQISEVTPFRQADLSPNRVHVLDAFFEVYVLVGAAAHDQFAAFRNACDFAQEYAILAAGEEDRPFVPVCSVVLEGCPRDLRRVFRKWRDDRCPTAMAPTGLKRGRSLRVVPLTQALQALRE